MACGCIYRLTRENSHLSRQLLTILAYFEARKIEREKEWLRKRNAPLEIIYILISSHITFRANVRYNRFSNISVIYTRVIIGYAHYRLLIIASSQRACTRQLCNNCKTVFCIVRSRRYYYRSDASIN